MPAAATSAAIARRALRGRPPGRPSGQTAAASPGWRPRSGVGSSWIPCRTKEQAANERRKMVGHTVRRRSSLAMKKVGRSVLLFFLALGLFPISLLNSMSIPLFIDYGVFLLSSSSVLCFPSLFFASLFPSFCFALLLFGFASLSLSVLLAPSLLQSQFATLKPLNGLMAVLMDNRSGDVLKWLCIFPASLCQISRDKLPAGLICRQTPSFEWRLQAPNMDHRGSPSQGLQQELVSCPSQLGYSETRLFSDPGTTKRPRQGGMKRFRACH